MMKKQKTLMVDMQRVEQIADKKALSLTMLAIKADLSPATIFSVKSGRRNPSQKTVFKIAAALNVEPSEIIKK